MMFVTSVCMLIIYQCLLFTIPSKYDIAYATSNSFIYILINSFTAFRLWIFFSFHLAHTIWKSFIIKKIKTDDMVQIKLKQEIWTILTKYTTLKHINSEYWNIDPLEYLEYIYRKYFKKELFSYNGNSLSRIYKMNIKFNKIFLASEEKAKL